MSLRMSKYERFRTGSISSPENPFTTVRRRNYFGLSYLILQSRYKISNRLKVDNAAFCKPSDINPITGNPIYRDFFTHSRKEDTSFSFLCTNRKPYKLYCRKTVLGFIYYSIVELQRFSQIFDGNCKRIVNFLVILYIIACVEL